MKYKMITHGEAAKRLGISRPTFLKMVKNGFPQAVIPSRKRTMIDERDITLENIAGYSGKDLVSKERNNISAFRESAY